MPAIHKGSPKIQFEFVASKRQSVLGGLPAIEALAQEFDLWNNLRRLSLIDPRKRKGSGFGPDAGQRQVLLEPWFAWQIEGSSKIGRLTADNDEGSPRGVALRQQR